MQLLLSKWINPLNLKGLAILLPFIHFMHESHTQILVITRKEILKVLNYFTKDNKICLKKHWSRPCTEEVTVKERKILKPVPYMKKINTEIENSATFCIGMLLLQIASSCILTSNKLYIFFHFIKLRIVSEK